MKINIYVKPRAREEYVKEIGKFFYEVSVKEPPVDGRANNAVIEALAKYFNVAKNKVFIVSGHTSRQKVVEII